MNVETINNSAYFITEAKLKRMHEEMRQEKSEWKLSK